MPNSFPFWEPLLFVVLPYLWRCPQVVRRYRRLEGV